MVRCGDTGSPWTGLLSFRLGTHALAHQLSGERLAVDRRSAAPPGPGPLAAATWLLRRVLAGAPHSQRECPVPPPAQAVQEFAEVCDDKSVGVKMSTDPQLGTVYSVDVPVRRARSELQAEAQGNADRRLVAGTFEWQENGMESDPSSRFPYGC